MAGDRLIDVHGVGNALVDLQVRVEDEFLTGLGLTKGQMVLVDHARQALVLKALAERPVNKCSGGSAANTIAGLAELGGRGAYSGKVGADAMGEFYVSDLERIGIAAGGGVSSEPTGISLVLITPDAQRTMLTHLGASATLCAADIDTEAIGRATWLYVEGYLLPGEATRGAALAAMEAAKRAGVRVALTVSDPFVVAACGDLLWEVIRSPVDLLFCNELEARALTGHDDPVESARAVHEHATNVALTLGPNGSLLMHDGALHPIEGVPVQAVDTTGAGDMYAAGILHGLTHGLSWPAAGRLASHAAARVVSHLGARLPRRFTAEEMQSFTSRA